MTVGQHADCLCTKFERHWAVCLDRLPAKLLTGLQVAEASSRQTIVAMRRGADQSHLAIAFGCQMAGHGLAGSQI